MKARRVVCSKCKGEVWKVSVKPGETTFYLTCAKCGQTRKIKAPSAREILEKNPEVVREYVRKTIEGMEV